MLILGVMWQSHVEMIIRDYMTINCENGHLESCDYHVWVHVPCGLLGPSPEKVTYMYMYTYN